MRSFWVGMAGIVIVADLASKMFMQEWLAGHGGTYELTPFLNLHSVLNTGVAFGLLADYGADVRTVITVVPFVICIVIWGFIMLYPRLTYLQAFTAALILGGGVGNGIERVFYGRVYDFIDFHLAGWHWPAFNVADMAISLSVVLIIWQMWWPRSKPQTVTNDLTNNS